MPAPKFASFDPALLQKSQDHGTTQASSSLAQDGSNKREYKPESFVEKQPKPSAHDQIIKQRKHKTEQDREASFELDIRGDPGNVTYGRNSSYQIPLYKEPNPRNLLASHHDRHDNFVARKNVLSTLSTKDKQTLQAPGRRLFRKTVLNQSQGNNTEEASDTEDFLAFPWRIRKTERSNGEAPRENPRSNPQSEDSSLSDSDTNSQPNEDRLLDLRARHAHLFERTQKSSFDVSAWLDLIDFQETWVKNGLGKNANYKESKASEHTIKELRLSLYVEAIKKVPKAHPLIHKLVHGMMSQVEQLWDDDKQKVKWLELTTEFANSPSVLALYIDFFQVNRNFCFEECDRAFGSWLDTIIRLLADTKSSSLHVGHLSQTIAINAVLHYTLFLQESGFSERAIALWQAILEVVYFKPEEISNEDVADAFELFWESEQARVGEIGAKGWCNSESSAIPARSYSATAETTLKSNNICLAWFRNESEAMKRSNLPARSEDDEVLKDPHRVVLFSDIRPFLSVAMHLKANERVINAFLTFCRLPPLMTLNWLQATTSSPSSHQSLFSSLKRLKDDGLQILSSSTAIHFYQAIARQAIDLLASLDINRLLLSEYILSLERNAALAKTFIKRNTMSLRLYNMYALLQNDMDHQRKQNTLSHGAGIDWCRTDNEEQDRILMSAIRLSRSFPEGIKDDVIFLWCTWIWKKVEHNDHFSAFKLISLLGKETFLSAANGKFPHTEGVSQTELADSHEYLIAVLDKDMSSARWQGDKDNVLYRALHTAFLLVLHGYLSTLHFQETIQHRKNYSDALSKALNLFQTMFRRFENDPAAEQAIGMQASELETGGYHPALEMLHQQQAELVRYHTGLDLSFLRIQLDDKEPNQELKSAPANKVLPHQERNVLESLKQSTLLFPDNKLISDTYVAYSTRSGIGFDAVRFALTNATSGLDTQSTSLTQHLSYIKFLLYAVYSAEDGTRTVTASAVRTAFERALSSTGWTIQALQTKLSMPQHDPEFWTLYFRFEVREAKLEKKKLRDRSFADKPSLANESSRSRSCKTLRSQLDRARAVFYRGFRALPWCKRFGMLAFEATDVMTIKSTNEANDEHNDEQLFNDIELRTVYDTMLKRGLRINAVLDSEAGTYR